MRNPILKALFLLVAFMLPPNSALAAAPTISSVTGTVATGQTLTITGTNMVQENTTNWINRFKTGSQYGFEGTSPLSDNYCDANTADCGCGYDSTTKLMGSKSIKCSVSGASSWPGSGYIEDGDAFDLSMNVHYGRTYFRYTNTSGVWPDNAFKLLLIKGSPNVEALFQPYPNGGNQETQFELQTTKGGGNSGTQVSFPNNLMQTNRWYLLEWYYNVNVGTVALWIDKTQTITRSIDTTNQNYFVFGIVNTFNTPSNFAADVRLDGLTIGNTRINAASAIEMSNNPTYEAGTLKYQEPVYLSDGSVQFKADLTGLGPGPYYLYVTNNGQATSSAYNLSGVGGGDTIAPSAPSGLKVQ